MAKRNDNSYSGGYNGLSLTKIRNLENSTDPLKYVKRTGGKADAQLKANLTNNRQKGQWGK